MLFQSFFLMWINDVINIEMDLRNGTDTKWIDCSTFSVKFQKRDRKHKQDADSNNQLHHNVKLCSQKKEKWTHSILWLPLSLNWPKCSPFEQFFFVNARDPQKCQTVSIYFIILKNVSNWTAI